MCRVVSTGDSSNRLIVTKVFRGGEKPVEDDWETISVGERIEAVWVLTRQCIEWTRSGTDEPRLQRSVSRVQRKGQDRLDVEWLEQHPPKSETMPHEPR
jgi:hypothetical protein